MLPIDALSVDRKQLDPSFEATGFMDQVSRER